MEEMDGRVSGWEKSSVNIEGKATPFCYQNPIAAAQYILEHPLFKNQLSYLLGKHVDSSAKWMYAESWTADWWWKMLENLHVLSERLSVIQISLWLSE